MTRSLLIPDPENAAIEEPKAVTGQDLMLRKSQGWPEKQYEQAREEFFRELEEL